MNLDFVKSFIQHCKEALSEDGVGSYSRYCGAACVSAAILWVSYLVFKNHALPDLGGVSTFIASGNAAYAANQAKKIAAAMKGVQNTDPAAQGQNQ